MTDAKELQEKELETVTGGDGYPYRDDSGHIHFCNAGNQGIPGPGPASGEYGLIEINSDPKIS